MVVSVAAYTPAFALADPCSAQLGYPIIPAIYANTIVTVVVPLSATCSPPEGSQLYATATAYDLNTNISADTVSTILTSVNGGFTFTGQLGFNLPASTQGHWVQIAVTVYSAQSAGGLTTTGEAFQVNSGTVQVVTTTVTQSTSNQFAPQPAETETNQGSRTIFAYVAIAAILAAVIIVTVGLLVYSRRPMGTYQPPLTY
jgi:hypothetical protein